MRSIVITLFASALMLTASCTDSKNSSSVDNSTSTADSLRMALEDRDSLISLMNEISAGLNEIKSVENLIASTPSINDGTPNQREQLRNDMTSVQMAIAERSRKLAELEAKLAGSNNYSATLRKSIENLKTQIAQQQETIANLRRDLASANVKIDELTANVDSLSTEVSTQTAEKEYARQQATNLSNELNLCYYAVGSKSELKDHKLIESGFLKKTKILPDDFEQAYFKTADKRQLNAIPLYSKNAKVLTNQPKDSYTLEKDSHGNYTLKITSPARFWSLTNYLVIQTN